MQKNGTNKIINKISKTPKIQIIKSKLSLKIILIFSLLILIIVSKNIIFSQKFDEMPFDQYEINIFNNIKDKLIKGNL